MRYRHSMRFGAQPLEAGGVRFALWAPAAGAVELLLERGPAASGGTGQGARTQAPAGAAGPEAVADALLMPRAEGGWFELSVPDAAAGMRYRYRIDGDLTVPDPASRHNPLDVHGASEVVDAHVFDWPDDGWRGRPWEEAVVYELHVGTFTPQGTFAAVASRLDYLAGLGVTAIELMPVAEFAGRRGWGYDGVLPYAPESSYGTPDDLKRLVAAAHARGLMVLLDVVYNHFGPEGNYLGAYAPQFFTDRLKTPWGAAIDYDGEHGRWVRRFAIDNALYWIEEFRFDGLRLDAVHAILSDTSPSVLDELADAVRSGPGRRRHVHLVLENDDNAARHLARDAALRPLRYTAQWDDDLHHALHVVATGQTDGYYADYAHDAPGVLARCLAEGFAYQGQASAFRQGARRGEHSAHLPPGAFVAFAQNHDQVGNRAFGERLGRLASPAACEAVAAIVLLAPLVPMLFMGEEFDAATPFLYFCDFEGDLARAVRDGRRGEFARFEQFADPAAAAAIPDPNAPSTFEASRLDWASLAVPEHAQALARCRALLAIRHREIVPRLAGTQGGHGHAAHGGSGLAVRWRLGDGSTLLLQANLGARPLAFEPPPAGARVLHETAGQASGTAASADAARASHVADPRAAAGSTRPVAEHPVTGTVLAAWAVRWTLAEPA